MEKVLNLYKPRGETPLETLIAFQADYPEYVKEKMTYAGRLDPMAEGVLIALVGEETKNREAYTALDKEYVFAWTFGVETDTYDLLGIVKKNENESVEPSEKEVEKFIVAQKGLLTQKYPPFSSKVVNGKNLFNLAKAGGLRKEDLPSHEVEIKDIEYGGTREVESGEFLSRIEKEVSAVNGDFRQSEILKRWKKFFAETDKKSFTIHKARIVTSSGFYVRQLVSDIGTHFKTSAVTVSILRTKVGDYTLEKSLRLH